MALFQVEGELCTRHDNSVADGKPIETCGTYIRSRNIRDSGGVRTHALSDCGLNAAP